LFENFTQHFEGGQLYYTSRTAVDVVEIDSATCLWAVSQVILDE